MTHIGLLLDGTGRPSSAGRPLTSGGHNESPNGSPKSMASMETAATAASRRVSQAHVLVQELSGGLPMCMKRRDASLVGGPATAHDEGLHE